MAFLAPALLFLAAFAGVPLLVHLLRRRVGRTVDFPAVRYLTRMEQEHSRERKLKHRLLLLLRILAVLALALAAARPIARLAGLGHAPVALALVIDNSMSTGAVRDGRAAFDELRGHARELLSAVTPDDRAWLVTADGRVIGGSASTLLEALDNLTVLGGRGDLAAATRRAIVLARSGTPRSPAVAVVSDGQASAWTDQASDSATARLIDAGDIPVQLLVRSGRVERNAAVVRADAHPARWTPTGNLTFAVETPDSAAWRVTLDGRTVARGTAAPALPGAAAVLSQRLSSASTGWIRGSVEIDADGLRGDDARWFAARVAPPPSVNARSEAGPFLSAAIATLIAEQRLQRGVAGARGVVQVSGADASLNAGPVLLTAPLDPVQVGDANRTLTRLGIPWRYGAIARDLVLVRGDAALDGVQVRVRYPLVHSPGGATSATADTLATAGGKPWVVAGDGYLLMASPIDPDATDLPLRAAFVPWLLDALSRRLGEDGLLIAASPGQHLIDREISSASDLERPDGSLIPLAGDRLTVPNESGVYFLRRQATRTGAIVVNPEPLESDLRADTAGVGASFRARIAGDEVATDTSAAEWRRHTLDQAAGRSLLTPLLLLALAALIAEAWFSRGTAATPSHDGDTPVAAARAA